MRKYLSFIGLAAIVISACNKTEESLGVRNQTPLLPTTEFNYSEQVFSADIQFIANGQLFNVTDARATLGRVLFYDTKLSVNNAISCGSCHKQNVAFADMTRFSNGFRGVKTTRNSPTTFNAGMNDSYFWDRRATTLTDQVLMPAFDHVEMGMSDINALVSKIRSIDYYAPLFEKAYGNEISPDILVTESKVRLAISNFLRSMLSLNSKFDQNNRGESLVGLEAEGRILFATKARCGSCHGGRNFGNWGAANIGLEMDYADKGIAAWSQGVPEGIFKIPTMRNIALTAPYMHDGRLATLDEVIEHYNSGILAHPGLDSRLWKNVPEDWGFNPEETLTFPGITPTSVSDIEPARLGLTQHEKVALKAFLLTLTDYSLINDPKFSDPFVYQK
ncbi:MAG: hypothetical protein JKX84_09550 [Flavobacteriales bacterium]|nr:hypothetical protein [Flavobacteriales bacterium]